MFSPITIKIEMLKRDMSRDQLAELLGVTRKTVDYRLAGRRHFTLPELNTLADTFECSIDYLAGRIDRKEVS